MIPVIVTAVKTVILAAALAHPAHPAPAPVPHAYTVTAGDTLSGIGAAHGLSWPSLWAANRGAVPVPDLITPGLALKLPPPGTRAPAGLALPRDNVAPAGLAPSPSPAPNAPAPVRVSGSVIPSGGMERCIIARESGGNSQVMNSSSHYGLYQFSASTWAGSGGNPADFGHASAAEQQRVFRNAVAARGYSDWTPYDGCH